jgi:hypothetical protein
MDAAHDGDSELFEVQRDAEKLHGKATRRSL